MDILRPQLLWLGKRCFRINNTIDINEQQQRQQKPTNTTEYIEDGEFELVNRIDSTEQIAEFKS